MFNVALDSGTEQSGAFIVAAAFSVCCCYRGMHYSFPDSRVRWNFQAFTGVGVPFLFEGPS